MNGYIRAEKKRVDWNVFDQIRITYTYEGNLSLSHMYTKKEKKPRRFNMKEIICSFDLVISFYFRNVTKCSNLSRK